jgi:hypothetical protein
LPSQRQPGDTFSDLVKVVLSADLESDGFQFATLENSIKVNPRNPTWHARLPKD